MAKSTDVSVLIRAFNKVFDQFTYRFDAATAFHDYLDYCIYVFNTGRDPREIERLKQTYREYYDVFPELFREHILAQQAALDGGRQWYDLLGTFYEAISSRSKSQALGQFFTPETVCDMMAQMAGPTVDEGAGKRINDPACGSGRTLLATHVLAPGNYLYGDDLDPMCAKMCAINFALHGVVGQVCCTNSLWPEEWRFGYEINSHLNTIGLISLRPIQRFESYSYKHWLTIKPSERAEPERKQNAGDQLKIF